MFVELDLYQSNKLRFKHQATTVAGFEIWFEIISIRLWSVSLRGASLDMTGGNPKEYTSGVN